ncbi:tetratricopeptide (TPR) repeat protein [Chryseobacterium bernardetii]|uniref:Tetratricopeptide repeat protein n=3 Tax=Chryseobacterium TaxID=59732 RepID=A0A543EH10_9FLAO|nr:MULTISPECIES: tetratricopeptide repeat protein [Chryseobacterium]MDR6372974.1 tetratricopeptide (TPR) repeat protein [Chryseobacterium vietnamense]MDR6443412.1 tetratricopeptide (TPR) repeat protein [Chryseobacterium bernardetii]MDR6457357.1 tetratricopeptide (TPR) repeat protein [Chryseobacterium vietnamense]MDR6486108.1 tetratricopeptide (TPR) repeat protein [Chryseobacterium vietnamense]TQM20857.1 tetratricopeptide repeat protein [Chryseobacterium aquifrigidense]
MKKTLLVVTSLCFSLNFYAQDKKLAEECFSKADYKCAEEQYLKLAEKEQIQKFQSEYYDYLGTSQRRLGKTTQAFKSYDSALKANPLSVSVYVNLSSLYSQKGNKVKALEYIEKGLQVNAETPDLYLTRSKIYDSQGKKELAIKDLNQILTFAPDNLFAKTGLANLKKNNGDLDGALKDYNKLLAEKPESLLYNGRADVYFKMKKYKEALVDANKAISIDPKFAQSYVSKAMILMDTSKIKEACENLDKAVALGYEKAVLTDSYTKCAKK